MQIPSTNQLFGCTRFYHLALADRRVTIGWTWLAASVRGTLVNRAKKFEMLRFAFETLKLNRVEFTVDPINLRSRRAIEKLGATQEEILRQHMVTHTHRIRDTVVYSIVQPEWPHIKQSVFSDFQTFLK